MFFLRWRIRSNLRVLPWMFTSPAVKKHVPRRHFGEHKSGTSDGASQPKKEIITSNTVLHRLTNLLFYTISDGQEQLPVNKFINTLKANGLLATDPRLKDCMDILHYTIQESMIGASMDLEIFQKCVQGNIVLLTQIVCKKFVIPDFEQFSLNINRLYENARSLKEGEVANYIPQLAKVSPDHWGVSLCTVDGQRHSVGDTDVPLCLQSCVKPLKYAIAVNDLGTDYVHQYVDKEPSGLRFNKLSLNHQGKPHNPMVNAGAIVNCSLIKGANKAEKFDYIMQFLKRMSGNEFIGFSNSIFQSEKETGDRNYAIGYYLKEKKCFPAGADMGSALDLYFQLCSIEVTCQSGSVIAATLANGGICPITGERVLSAESVRNTLSLMHSCGMYDFSGEFAFHVGLPAKSGVSGAILLVVPNIMGLFCWSPPLDRIGNSVRGIHFCHELVSLFNFHHFDNLRHCVKKLDPRKEKKEIQQKTVVNLLFAAYSGDVSALRRFALSSMDMEQKDYDCRTALHVAAAEGHLDVVKFLIDGCRVNPFVEDRWKSIPLQDAIRFERHDVVKLLTEYQETYVKRQMGTETSEEHMSLQNLESMV
ncbi:glutaminase liver isoform, mitochondrial isoform X2 [Rhinoderma darwinii]|uniref:glutaminase liver isoform, mitochondrial isoform X2 n=1 Tax=Rhinoderma darwinii TaxID=43563 RepID=UPI003F679C9B